MHDVLDEWDTMILVWKMEEEEGRKRRQRWPCFEEEGMFCITYSWFCGCKVNQVSVCLEISRKIKELNHKLDYISIEKDRYTFNTSNGSTQTIRNYKLY